MAEGAGRWTLSRAGIINVYQYGNEILQFAGGRTASACGGPTRRSAAAGTSHCHRCLCRQSWR